MTDNAETNMGSSSLFITNEFEKCILQMTDEEFDRRVVQLRRIKAENARLSAALNDPEGSLQNKLNPNLLRAILVPVHTHTDLDNKAFSGVAETVSRSYSIGKEHHLLQVRGVRKRVEAECVCDAYWWNCNMEAQYRGLTGKAFNKGRHVLNPRGTAPKIKSGEDEFFVLFQRIAADLGLGENVGVETKLALIRLFWGDNFMDHAIMFDYRGDWTCDMSFRDFLELKEAENSGQLAVTLPG
jgi:hypothetical protein